MRIATWNVNSAKQRMPRLLPWLEQRRPDVVCLQETKLTDSAFHELLDAALAGLGYEVAHHGHGGFNGVALLSRVGLDDVVADFPGQPQYEGVTEARALSATCDGVRIHSLYVPNGREVGSPPLWPACIALIVTVTASTSIQEVGVRAGPSCRRSSWDGRPQLQEAWKELRRRWGTGRAEATGVRKKTMRKAKKRMRMNMKRRAARAEDGGARDWCS